MKIKKKKVTISWVLYATHFQLEHISPSYVEEVLRGTVFADKDVERKIFPIEELEVAGVKAKRVVVEATFSEVDFELKIITPEYIERVLKEKHLIGEGLSHSFSIEDVEDKGQPKR